MTQTLKVGECELGTTEQLEGAVKRAADMLENKSLRTEFKYPGALKGSNEEAWDTTVIEIETTNAELLGKLKGKAGIYALFVNDEPSPRYIGQRKGDGGGIAGRLKQHLIKKNHRTGSKLADVQKEVISGHQVLVCSIEINPEELRTFFEAMLIREFLPQWNMHGKTKKSTLNDSEIESNYDPALYYEV
jgi:hypothetical protein